MGFGVVITNAREGIASPMHRPVPGVTEGLKLAMIPIRCILGILRESALMQNGPLFTIYRCAGVDAKKSNALPAGSRGTCMRANRQPRGDIWICVYRIVSVCIRVALIGIHMDTLKNLNENTSAGAW